MGSAPARGKAWRLRSGHAGTRLHEWFFPTRTFRAMQGLPGGSTGIDDAFASAWEPGIGAEIMGRGIGPHHGPWPDQEWTGWWGDTPPFRTPVFVLTHHLRPSVQMNGGTTFDFLDASPAQALVQARQAAAGRDVRIGGGPSTIREFLAAGLIDYAHIVVVPIVRAAGSGSGTGWRGSKNVSLQAVNSPSGVTHVTLSLWSAGSMAGQEAGCRQSRSAPHARLQGRSGRRR